MSFRKKFNEYSRQFLKEDAAMPIPGDAPPEGGEAPPAGDAPAPEAQTPESTALAPSAEVLLIRDMLKALVIQLPSDTEVTDLVNEKVPEQLPKVAAQQIHEKVANIIERYKTYEDNEQRLKNVEKIVVNESNRRDIYKKIVQVLEKYSGNR